MALIFNIAPSKIPAEYSDYSNIFSGENAVKLPKNTGMNEHAIELEEDKQPLLQINALSQKTSIGFGNLCIGDWWI